MDQKIKKICFISGLIVLTACGENGSSEITKAADLNNTESNTDSLDFSEIELLEIPGDADGPVAAGEELLAENLEETEEAEPSDYIQTEMQDVVLSRKTPVPSATSDEDNIFGTWDDNKGDGNGDGWGDGVTVDRKIIKSPAIVNPTKEEGIVSVKVKVDSDGNVVETEVLQSHHTNTGNKDLFQAASKYARQYKFEADPSVFVSNQIIDIRFE